MHVVKDLWGFLTIRKKWWLMPTVFFLMIVAILSLATGSIVVSPILYAIF
ncbi:MAG: DUF5989 family protein [Bacteroidota bacterium]|nr:DUF5989 family protein [Bacteroidota bacterium]